MSEVKTTHFPPIQAGYYSNAPKDQPCPQCGRPCKRKKKTAYSATYHCLKCNFINVIRLKGHFLVNEKGQQRYVVNRVKEKADGQTSLQSVH